MNSIYFTVKSEVSIDKHQILTLFFKDWLDTSCNNEVNYVVESMKEMKIVVAAGIAHSTKRFKVEFERQEDALALRLRGVPSEFQNYLEIVN